MFLGCLLAGAPAPGGVVTYQGWLQQSNAPVQGVVDLRFALFDAASGGAPVGGALTNRDVETRAGVFTTGLDFGEAAFNGDPRWLEIWVRTGTNPFTALSPRQAVTAVPYALQAGRVPAAGITGIISADRLSTNVALLGVSGRLAADVLPANVARLDASQTFTGVNVFAGGVGVGVTNPATALHVEGTVTASAFRGGGLQAWQVMPSLVVTAAPNSYYLATNPGVSVLTLPPAPLFGDVVRLSAVGGGGWKLAQNEGQSILTARLGGTAAGRAWMPLGSARDWKAVSCSSDGTKLAAVAAGEPVYTSTNSGAVWTASESARAWSTVASSSDGAKLVAAVSGGTIYTSTNFGADWTSRESSRDWKKAASSADGTRLCAVAGAGYIYCSANSGSNWTPRGAFLSWTAVASSGDGARLLAAPVNSPLYTSADYGANWTPRESARNWCAVACSADGTRLVAAVRNGLLYTSADTGGTWAPRASSQNWQALAMSADGSIILAAAQGAPLQISRDSGATFVAGGAAGSWTGAALSSEGAKFLAAEGGGWINVSVPTTLSGTNGWLAGSAEAEVETQYVGAGQWRVRGWQGTVTSN